MRETTSRRCLRSSARCPTALEKTRGGARGSGAPTRAGRDVAIRYIGDESDDAVDSRLMLQLGMLLAALYAASLCVWFAAIRGMHGSGPRLDVGSGVRRVRASGCRRRRAPEGGISCRRPGGRLAARPWGRRVDVRDRVAARSHALALPGDDGATGRPALADRG
jgi:hypothetical protein